MEGLEVYVGERIKARLDELNLDQKDLAPLLGKDETTISRKLDGKSPLSIEELNKIADFLACHAADFFPPKLGDRIIETMAAVPFTDFVKFLVKDEVEKSCAELKAQLLNKHSGG